MSKLALATVVSILLLSAGLAAAKEGTFSGVREDGQQVRPG